MAEHRPAVADVFREFATEYLAKYGASIEEERVLRAIIACKTAALGGHKARCSNSECEHEAFFYNSCRNRHCPNCQGAARAEWLEKRTSELLETPYFHVVFTLPEALAPIALRNKRLLYRLLFRASAETLQKVAINPKHLGAEIGILSVLHTWGQTLNHHPHIHCVVPGGGFSPDRTSWIPVRESFFLPVRVLSRVFRGKFLSYLRDAYDNGELELPGKLAHLAEKSAWIAFVRALSRTEWVVYSKPPFGGPKQVLKYLARYTHRVAISNQRILAMHGGKVTFQYKDYRTGNVERTMTLAGTEFMRRFLQHVLPGSFHRIRYYGFLSNRDRAERIALARELLPAPHPREEPIVPPEPPAPSTESPQAPKDPLCPVCGKGHLILVGTLLPDPRAFPAFLDRVYRDTS
jgi:hypothetical protein